MRNTKFLLCSIFLGMLMAFSLTTPVLGAVQEDNPRQLTSMQFEMLVLDWDTFSVDAGYAIADALEEIGIKVTVNELDDSVFYPRVYYNGYYNISGGDLVVVDKLRDFQAYEMSSGYSPVPNHVYFRMHSSQDYHNGDNHQGLHNDTLDDALEKVQEAITQAELKAALNDVQAYAADLLPYFPLFVSDDSHVIRKEWNGYVQLPGGIFTSFNPWTFLNMSAVGETEFRMAYPSDISYLNPLDYTDERSGWWATAIYDTLIAYDDKLAKEPWLAESWALATDGKQVNFTLRSGVKWHDGADLTPEDVKFTIELIQNTTDSPRYSSTIYVDDITIDGQVISIDLSQPYGFIVDDLGQLKILPKHIWEPEIADLSVFNTANNATLHVGSGPYVYTSGITGGGPYVATKNANYWYTGGLSMPNLQTNPLPAGTYPKINTISVEVASERVLGMENDDYDSERYEADVSVINQIGTTYNNIKLVNTPSQWDYYMVLNTKIKPFDDVNVRRAMQYALDRDAIAQAARGDYATVTDSVVPDCFYPDYYNPNINKYSYNVAKAKELLDAGGYVDEDGDGWRDVPVESGGGAPGFDFFIAIFGMFVMIPIIRRKK